MPVDTRTIEKVNYFLKKFKQPHLDLAYHLAFPITFTPDLAYQIWAHFQMDSANKEYLQIPWIAVADVLLSFLCEEVQHETYQMDDDVRLHLLKKLREDERFGRPRLRQLAHFLRHYVSQQLSSQNKSQQRAAKLQEQQALSVLAPQQVIRELAQELNNRNLREGQARLIDELVEQFLSTAELSTENTAVIDAFNQLGNYSQLRIQIADPDEDSEQATEQMRTHFGDHPIIEKQPLLSWRAFQPREPIKSETQSTGVTSESPFVQQSSPEQPPTPFPTPSPTTIPPNGYINFDIRIHSKQGETYPMEASHSYEGGESTGTIQQAFDLEDKEFQDLLLFLTDLVGEAEDARKFGNLLKQMLFPEQVWSLFNSLRQTAYTEQIGVRIRLFIDPPELRYLPWEYCYESQNEQGKFFALDLNTPFVRYIEQTSPSSPLMADSQLKILLVIAEPTDLSEWDNTELAEQTNQLLNSLPSSMVHLEVIKNATFEKFQKALADFQPHIVHFATHGENKNGEELLFLENSDGQKHGIDTITLTNLVRIPSIKLIVFEYKIIKLAEHLIRSGIPSIITHQFDLPQKASLHLFQTLYEELPTNPSIDIIITKMRLTLFQKPEPENQTYWAIPILFTRSPDAVIWQRPEHPETEAGEETAATQLEIEELETAGDTLQTEGNYQEALQAYQEAANLRRQLGSDHLDLLHTLNQIGRLLLYQIPNYPQAQTVLEEALAIGREYGQIFVGTAETLALLGHLYFLLDDIEQAQPYLEEAIAKWQELTMGGSEFQAQTYTYLGDIFQTTGQPKQAISLYQEALDMQRTIADMFEQPLGRPTSDVLDKLGDLYAEIGEIDTALQHYEEARQLYRELLGENDPATVETHRKLEQLLRPSDQSETPTRAVVTLGTGPVPLEVLNVRTAPSHDGRIITALSEGTAVTILEEANVEGQTYTMTRVRTDEGEEEGWVVTNYLTITEAHDPSSSISRSEGMTTDEIEAEITAQQALQNAYEKRLDLTTDPREEQRLQTEIRKIKLYIFGLQTELTKLREAVKTTKATKSLEPELINHLNPYERIPPHAVAVLKATFNSGKDVTVLRRFSLDLGSGLLYIVQPERQLPNIIKIDYYEKILQEWDAVMLHIAQHIPHAILETKKPTNLEGSEYAGLLYPLMGVGSFQLESLYYFLREQPTTSGQAVLNRLFRIIQTIHKNRLQKEIWLQSAYDDILPQNFIIDCSNATTHGQLLTPQNIYDIQFNQTDPIQVNSEWIVAEYLRQENGLEIRHPNPRDGFRMRLINVEGFIGYNRGQPLGEIITGTVRDTRFSIFESALAQTIHNFDIFAPRLSSFHNYPNPLYHLEGFLRTSVNGFIGPIHGDLKLENVIVNPEVGNIHIINFIKSRKDHIIRDYIQIEVNLVVTLLTETAISIGYDSNNIKEFYERLHYSVAGQAIDPPPNFEKIFELILTIRKEATHALIDRKDWREYEKCLFIYLLGALRYKQLGSYRNRDSAKKTILYAASTLLNILQGNFDPQQLLIEQTIPKLEPPHPLKDMSVSKMREVIMSTFSEEQLRDFILNLSDSEADADSFGSSKADMARELIGFYRRRNALPELQQALFEARPSSDWWGKT